MPYRSPLLFAGILGLTGVALGAFGAHGLREILAQHGSQSTWELAVQYQLIHTIALLGVALWLKLIPGNAAGLMTWAARLWIIGIFCFSGSLYGLAVGGPRFLGPITPLGGLAFLAGWACLIVIALRDKPAAKS